MRDGRVTLQRRQTGDSTLTLSSLPLSLLSSLIRGRRKICEMAQGMRDDAREAKDMRDDARVAKDMRDGILCSVALFLKETESAQS